MRRRGIFIELTALLDVILLMLFLLLSQMQASLRLTEQEAEREVAEAAQAVRAASRAAAAAEADAGSLRRQLEETREQLGRSEREELSLGIVDEHSTVITLSVQEGLTRRVRIEPEGETAFYITLGEARQTRERLYQVLADLLGRSEEETVFCVFQYDRGAIYHAEYELISSVLLSLKAEAPSLDIALNVIETDILEKEAEDHG